MFYQLESLEKNLCWWSFIISNIMKNFANDVTYAYCDNKNNNSYINKLLNKKIRKIKLNVKQIL